MSNLFPESPIRLSPRTLPQSIIQAEQRHLDELGLLEGVPAAATPRPISMMKIRRSTSPKGIPLPTFSPTIASVRLSPRNLPHTTRHTSKAIIIVHLPTCDGTNACSCSEQIEGGRAQCERMEQEKARRKEQWERRERARKRDYEEQKEIIYQKAATNSNSFTSSLWNLVPRSWM